MRRRPKLEVYLAEDGWRWRLIATNGRLIAESGEAYTERNKVYKAWERVVRAVRGLGPLT